MTLYELSSTDETEEVPSKKPGTGNPSVLRYSCRVHVSFVELNAI